MSIKSAGLIMLGVMMVSSLAHAVDIELGEADGEAIIGSVPGTQAVPGLAGEQTAARGDFSKTSAVHVFSPPLLSFEFGKANADQHLLETATKGRSIQVRVQNGFRVLQQIYRDPRIFRKLRGIRKIRVQREKLRIATLKNPKKTPVTTLGIAQETAAQTARFGQEGGENGVASMQKSLGETFEKTRRRRQSHAPLVDLRWWRSIPRRNRLGELMRWTGVGAGIVAARQVGTAAGPLVYAAAGSVDTSRAAHLLSQLPAEAKICLFWLGGLAFYVLSLLWPFRDLSAQQRRQAAVIGIGATLVGMAYTELLANHWPAVPPDSATPLLIFASILWTSLLALGLIGDWLITRLLQKRDDQGMIGALVAFAGTLSAAVVAPDSPLNWARLASAFPETRRAMALVGGFMLSALALSLWAAITRAVSGGADDRSVKVADEVVDVLNTDRKPDQAVG